MTTVQVSHEEDRVFRIIKASSRPISTGMVALEMGMAEADARSLINSLWNYQLIGRTRKGGIEFWAIVPENAGAPRTQGQAPPVAPKEPDPPVDEPHGPEKQLPVESPEDKAEESRKRRRDYQKKWYAEHRYEVLSKKRESYGQKNGSKKPSPAPAKAPNVALAAQMAEALSKEIHTEALKQAERIVQEALSIVRSRRFSK